MEFFLYKLYVNFIELMSFQLFYKEKSGVTSTFILLRDSSRMPSVYSIRIKEEPGLIQRFLS